MKMKTHAIIYMLLLFFGANLFQYFDHVEAQTNEPVVIPDEAIRLRILANSNGKEDQEIKRLVRDAVNEEITKWVEDLTSIKAARDLIKQRIDELEAIVANVLVEEGLQQSYSVKYGENIKFPTKMYGNYIYPAGKYEAILITLGEGQGANWWCVLFPPLCFLDFSNGDAVKEPQENDEPMQSETNSKKDVEVKFFVVEWFQKIFDHFA